MNFTDPSLYGVTLPQRDVAWQQPMPFHIPWQWQQSQRWFVPSLGQYGATPYPQGFPPYMQQSIPAFPEGMSSFPYPYGYSAPFPTMGGGFQGGPSIYGNFPFGQWPRPLAYQY